MLIQIGKCLLPWASKKNPKSALGKRKKIGTYLFGADALDLISRAKECLEDNADDGVDDGAGDGAEGGSSD